MKNLKIKQKILILTVLPLLFTVAALTMVSIKELQNLGAAQISQIKATMEAEKRQSLKSYVDIAKTSVQPLLASPLDADDSINIARIKEAIRSISFGEDGYVFAFTYNGDTMVHAAKPQLEGRNLMGLEDVNGVRIIADLIRAARNGGGYVNYIWDKPSRGYEVNKLSYAVDLKELGWMIGAGFYTDDIDDAILKIQKDIDQKVRDTVISSAIIGFIILILIAVFNISFSTRALVRPIEDLAESSRQMSMGKMDVDIKVNSKDEIGELAEAIKRMQKSLSLILKKMSSK